MQIKVHPQKSIKQLKRDIEKREGISWMEQQLYLKGRKLKDELTLSDYKISQNTMLCILPIKVSNSKTKIQMDSNIKRTTIQIFVKVINNSKIFTFDVCVTDSIQSMKKIICNKLGVNIQKQKLTTSSGTPLRDELKLMDYNIKNDQTLYFGSWKIRKVILSVGDKINCRDRWGKWYLSEIKKCNYSGEPIPHTAHNELNQSQKAEIDRLVCLDAVYVHYIDWQEKWNEWIFIKNNTVCDCSGLCNTAGHRIAPCDTQIKLYAQNAKLKQESLKQEGLKQDILLKKERLRKERIKQERLKQEKLKQERLKRERLKQERLKQERIKQEKLKQERLKQERLKQERLKQERLKQEKLKQERLKRERLNSERLKWQTGLALSVGDKIDCRDRWGKWCLSEIKKYKYSGEPIPHTAHSELNQIQKADIYQLVCLDAVYVHYIGWQKKWNEWIFIKNNTVCDCSGLCDTDSHRIAIHTNSKIAAQNAKIKQERSKQELLRREKLKHERLKQERLKQERLKRERLKQEKLQEERLKKLQLRRTQFVGKRFDIYDLTIKQWWPCTVIDADHEYIKVTYDGYSSKYDEWIKNNKRIAAIHKHTKNHKMHKKLTNESEKRKKEWNVRNLNMINFSSSQSNSCLYYNECVKIMEQYMNKYGITRTMFDLSGNMCFCEKCHGKRGDKETYSRGKPSQVYVLPIGYARFGIKLSSNQIKENIFEDWHVVYHGTKSAYIKEISESGLILLKPNDFKLDKNGPKYKTNKIRSGHIQQKFIRTNKHTKQKETFDPEQIFTSPSCIYASNYCDEINIDNNIVSFMFQCRQKPATYCRGQETMCFDDTQIDKFINNNCIEFYTKHNLNIAITGILIKIHSFGHSDDESEQSISDNDESVVSEKECTGCDGSGLYDIGMCFQCNGTAYCRKCNGSGIWKRALSCNKCDGSGLYRNRGKCRSCKGSGIFKPALKCRFCKGKGECVKCHGTGRFKRECRRCSGSGVV